MKFKEEVEWYANLCKWNLIFNTSKGANKLQHNKYFIKFIIFFPPDYLLCILTLKKKVLFRNLDLDLALIRVPKTYLSFSAQLLDKWGFELTNKRICSCFKTLGCSWPYTRGTLWSRWHDHKARDPINFSQAHVVKLQSERPICLEITKINIHFLFEPKGEKQSGFIIIMSVLSVLLQSFTT